MFNVLTNGGQIPDEMTIPGAVIGLAPPFRRGIDMYRIETPQKSSRALVNLLYDQFGLDSRIHQKP
jgi:hypothetical protein